MKIFIDVDNTILEHSGFYSIDTENRIHSSIGKFPIENKKAISMMYESAVCRNPDILRALFAQDNVYILTKYPSIEYEHYKQVKLAEVLEISHKDLLTRKDSQGINKYIMVDNHLSKVDVIKDLFKVTDLKDFVLIDDYSTNLIEWSTSGGMSIKFYNEYNNPTHPLKGLSISNFNIFIPYLKKDNAYNLMMSCLDNYIFKTFLDSFTKDLDSQIIDMLELTYYDLKDKFSLEKVDVKNKYNFRNFLIEYFHFIDSLDYDYWKDKVKDKITFHDKAYNIITSSFDIDFKKHNPFNQESLAIKILEPQVVKSKNIYDIYLTLDPNAFLSNVDTSLEKLASDLRIFLIPNK